MTEAASTNRQWIRSAVDFSALAAFALAFVILRARGVDSSEALVQATWALVGGSAVALAVGFFVEKRLALLPLLTGGFALVFGVLTLFFDDALFVKLKVTVLNLFLAALLLGGTLMGKYPLKALLGDAIKVNDAAWRTLTLRYGVYFLAVALVNEVVRSRDRPLVVDGARDARRRGRLGRFPRRAVDRRLDLRRLATASDHEESDQGRTARPDLARHGSLGREPLKLVTLGLVPRGHGR